MSDHSTPRDFPARIPDLGQVVFKSAQRAGLEARAVAAMVRAGAIDVLEPPHRLAAVALAVRAYGTFGSAVQIAAIRHGNRPAIVDEQGELTYADLDQQINRLADALLAKGLASGDTVAILCRNHRVPLVAAFAASRAGLNTLWLNTSFSARQVSEVCEREGLDLLIHDVDFDSVVGNVHPLHGRIRCSLDASPDEFDALVATGAATAPPAPSRPGRIVLLTSGTTGTPKGAPRPEPRGFTLPGGVLERMPMRARGTTVIGPPLYHGTGLLLAILSVALGSRIVLRPKFSPAQLLDDMETYQASTVCLVPVMLQRLLELGDDEITGRNLKSLNVIFCAGSQLPAKVASRATDLLGEVIYNLYGSTEVSVATLATPLDVREAPTSVGKPALGVTIRILDDNGAQLPVGTTGRIFVGTTSPFEGYTGGGGKEVVDGMMGTGDLGHFDDNGRLYIDGRDDEMIVSGGENLFPREVEELLVTHPAIADAAVIGVEDDDFGQRLKAFCVLRAGRNATEDEVRDFVKDNLARFKAPRDVVFLDELPRNPTGKVLKRELARYKS